MCTLRYPLLFHQLADSGKVDEFSGTPAFLRSETELAEFRAKHKMKAVTQLRTR